MSDKKQNPFAITFGKTPELHIERTLQTQEITNAFESDNPLSQAFVITGARGSGKTVMLTDIAKHFSAKRDWIVIPLNPDRDMLQSFAAKLHSASGIRKSVSEKSIGFSLAGITAGIKTEAPAEDVETVLIRILKKLKEQNKKVLVTVDEAVSSQQLREFASAFQILVREDLPVFMLMTGLYDNIKNIQNQKTLTFLYRTPHIVLEPLNLKYVCDSYQDVFNISFAEAKKLALLCNGYAFAYQVLGYLLWESNKTKADSKLLREYDKYLADFSYEKIWSELSENDRRFLVGMVHAKTHKVSELMDLISMPKSEFSVYRDRMKKRGLVDTSKRGELSILLPRFDEYIRVRIEF